MQVQKRLRMVMCMVRAGISTDRNRPDNVQAATSVVGDVSSNSRCYAAVSHSFSLVVSFSRLDW